MPCMIRVEKDRKAILARVEVPPAEKVPVAENLTFVECKILIP
jgi:hypothetical protein